MNTAAGSADCCEPVSIHLVPPGVPDPTDKIDDAVVTGRSALFEDLVGDAVAGEPVARARLLNEVHPLVLRYCRGRLGRRETAMGSADDVAQDVCLAVVRALPTYRHRHIPFTAFVYGIAAHKVTDAFRAIGRNRSDPMADVPDTETDLHGPEHQMLATDLSRRLGELLHELTPRQREVIVLRVAVGLSAEETARVVGSTPATVRATQHRALVRLRQIMQQRLPQAPTVRNPSARPCMQCL